MPWVVVQPIAQLVGLAGGSCKIIFPAVEFQNTFCAAAQPWPLPEHTLFLAFISLLVLTLSYKVPVDHFWCPPTSLDELTAVHLRYTFGPGVYSFCAKS